MVLTDFEGSVREARVEGCRLLFNLSEALLGSPHRVTGVQVPPHEDLHLFAAATPALLGDLQPHLLQDHGVVLAHDLFVFALQHLIQVHAPQPHEGRRGSELRANNRLYPDRETKLPR
ncbi:MAG: hypothetical protein U0610_04355 [bacterium]